MTRLSRVMVTGAAGQLGSAVVARLRQRCEVVALTRAELDIADDGAVLEAARAASPDAIVMMSNRTSVDAPHPADQVLATAALAGSPAVANKRFTMMEGTYLLGFGPRLAEAARDLANFLHPELKLKSG